MRTTLDIDDDVLAAARELAKAEGKTMGTVISKLVRQALTTPSYGQGVFSERQAGFDEGDAKSKGPVWHTLPHREGTLVTPEMIERIQDEIDLEDATPWDHETDQPRRS
jgi:hypothetical protein